ncbi:Rv3235 family protein [Actinomadura macrotermitis]|uniref:Uncharacterized protein n=1 Tax=Actinomadura macrotermitis TaxID=2585200 RepID=A0A7K0C0W2_9ACTN|nr:Rv3235 family protein [Actinomadura macrotermitis]MQY07101.1 hypothetical protein [Actinomadura macrotermitis]
MIMRLASSTLSATTAPRPALEVVRYERRAALHLVRPSPADGPVPDAAELRAVADASVRLIVEVLTGVRPPRQLARLAVREVYDGIAAHRQAVAAGARVRPPRILTSWLQRPAPGVAEAGAVVAAAGRVQAIALRLEERGGRWRCTALETTAARPGPAAGHARALRRAG